MIKKTIITLVLILAVLNSFSQKYEANWESLDTRPTPEWFGDAKFGIFIHWGPSSVPAWSPAGTYTEWYQYWWYSHSIFGNNKPDKDAIPNLQKKVYGEESSYYDFGRMFKAELYDPDEWAELFKKSGARYVVLTSKHHDGFTLWPNEHAQDARYFKWNAAEVGAKMDLIGPFMDAIRGAGLKAGLYYSLYEWYHPWYMMGSEKFVTDHYHPQFKDLVNKYKPDLIYADGEWERDDSYWKSNEMIQWLFNESPAKDYVVINDRWFKGSRHKHGGFYTTEYLREPLDLPKAWEEIRGIGTSFGYNRDEDLEDYATAQQLVLMLCDIVSMGGNLCLNVSPAADGKIPVIQQQRLMEIGSWLNVNGEAIYKTSKFDRSWQWTKGNQSYRIRKPEDAYTRADYIIRQTLEQEDGMALKELFFTRNANTIFAISPKWPGSELIIRDIEPESGSHIQLLGVDEYLDWEQKGKDIIIKLPAFDPNWKLPGWAYAFKIEMKK